MTQYEITPSLIASFFEQQMQPAFWMTPVLDGQGTITDFEYTYCNEEFFRYTGLSGSVVVGKRLTNSPIIKSETGRSRLFNELLQVYQEDIQQIKWIHNPDIQKYYSYTRKKVHNGVLTVLQDRTEEFQMMQQLQEQKQLMDNLLRHSANGIAIFQVQRPASAGIQGRIILANEAFTQLTGVPLHAAISSFYADSNLEEHALATLETGKPFTYPFYMEGAGKWLELTISRMDAYHLINIVTDISADKQAQKRLEAAVARMDAIFRSAQSGMFIFAPERDAKGEIVDFRFVVTNPSFASYVGQQPETLNGALGSTYFPGYLTNGVFAMYRETYLTGQTLRKEVHYNVDGHDLYLDLQSTKVDDEVLVTFNDYSSLKKAQHDLERMVEELQWSNKNLEQFAYATSHDLKEPLRKMLFFTDRLRIQLDGQMAEGVRASLGRLEYAARRMSQLVDDLLDYSFINQGVENLETVDLNKKVELVLEDFEVSIQEKNATINVSALPTIMGNKRQMLQLFTNLISNGLKYHKEGLAPEINITYERVGGADYSYRLPLNETSSYYHLIRVSDNGIGFDAEDAERIFNVFTRLHGINDYAGTGVGLAIVKKVVENHKGAIWATSSPGAGATFLILLPAIG